MTFECSKFYQSYRQHKDIAVKQKLFAFWDLETDTQLASSEQILAVIVVGLEAFGELAEPDVQAIHVVIGARIQINYLPSSVVMLIHSLLAQLQLPGKPSAYAHAAALVAADAAANVESLDSEFKNLFGSIDYFVERLAVVFRTAGDVIREAELYQLQTISECTKAK